MPKGNRQATGRPSKPHKIKRIKLSEHLVPIAENSLNNATATIELGLSILETKAIAALEGDESAISMLGEFGVEAKAADDGVIIVYKPSGEVSAWIV